MPGSVCVFASARERGGLHKFRNGDQLVALAAGAARWCLQQGPRMLAAIRLVDTDLAISMCCARRLRLLARRARQGLTASALSSGGLMMCAPSLRGCGAFAMIARVSLLCHCSTVVCQAGFCGCRHVQVLAVQLKMGRQMCGRRSAVACAVCGGWVRALLPSRLAQMAYAR